MALKTGQLAVSGSAQQLSSTHIETKLLILKAHAANANPVYLGPDNTVTTSTGFQISAGESLRIVNSQTDPGSPVIGLDPDELYVIGTAGTDRVSWQAIT